MGDGDGGDGRGGDGGAQDTTTHRVAEDEQACAQLAGLFSGGFRIRFELLQNYPKPKTPMASQGRLNARFVIFFLPF